MATYRPYIAIYGAHMAIYGPHMAICDRYVATYDPYMAIHGQYGNICTIWPYMVQMAIYAIHGSNMAIYGPYMVHSLLRSPHAQPPTNVRCSHPDAPPLNQTFYALNKNPWRKKNN